MDLLSFIRQLLPPHHRKPVTIAFLRVLFGPAERLFRDVETLLNRFVGFAQTNGQMKSLEYALNVAAGFPSGDGPIYLLNGAGKFDFQVVVPTGVPADIMSAIVVTLERYRLKSKRYRIATEESVTWGDNPGENPNTTTLRFKDGYPRHENGQLQMAVAPAGTYSVRIYKDGVEQIPPGDIVFGADTVYEWPGLPHTVAEGLYRTLIYTPGVEAADKTVSVNGRVCDLAWDDNSTATTEPALSLIYLTGAAGGGGIYTVRGRVISAYADIFPLTIERRQGTGEPVLIGMAETKSFSFDTSFADGTFQLRATDRAGCKTIWKTINPLVPGACDLSFAVAPTVERVNNQYRVTAQVSSARSNIAPYAIAVNRGTEVVASASASTNPIVLLLPVGTASGAVTVQVVDAQGCQATASLTLPAVATTASFRVGYRRDGNAKSLEVLAKVPDAGVYYVAITPLSGQSGTNLTNARPMVVTDNTRYGLTYNRQYQYSPGFAGGVDVLDGRWRIAVFKENEFGSATVVEVQLTGQTAEGDLTPVDAPDTTPTPTPTPGSGKFFGFSFQPIPSSAQPANGELVLQNGRIKVIRSLNAGGGIIHVSENGGPNLVNDYDLGRQLNTTVYSGPHPFNPNPALYPKPGPDHPFSRFGYNPIETGSYNNQPSVIEAYGYDEATQTHYIRSRARNFPTQNFLTGYVFERWFRLVGVNIVRNWYRLTYNRANDDVTVRDANGNLQRFHAEGNEMPILYGNAAVVYKTAYHTGSNVVVVDHRGAEGAAVYGTVATGEPWIAAINDQNQGLGVTGPDVFGINGDMHGDWPDNTGEFGATSLYMANIVQKNMDPMGVTHFMFDVVVGSVEDIRTAARLHPVHNPANTLLDYNFSNARHDFFCQNGLMNYEGTGGAVVIDILKNNVNFRSPASLFRASDHLAIYLRMKNESGTDNLAFGFRKPGQSDGSPNNGEINFTCPRDGQYHTITLNTASLSNWTGNLSAVGVRLNIGNENNVEGQGHRLSFLYLGKTNPESTPVPDTNPDPTPTPTPTPGGITVLKTTSTNPSKLSLSATVVNGWVILTNDVDPGGGYYRINGDGTDPLDRQDLSGKAPLDQMVGVEWFQNSTKLNSAPSAQQFIGIFTS